VNTRERTPSLGELLGVDDPAPEPEVLDLLDTTGPDDSPRPMSTLRNVYAILVHDSRWTDRLRFNAFSNRILYDDEPLQDHHATRIAIWCDQVYKVRPSTAKVSEAVTLAAREASFHPVRAYLDGLVWDGVPRTETWLIDHLGVEDQPLHRIFGERFLTAAVARVMDPGCKMDTCLVLKGRQGVGKSQVPRILAGDDWFSDSDIDLGSKDKYQQLDGVWIYEIAELQSFRGREATAVKAFMTSQTDNYRPPFGRHRINVPRQTVFVGTTNDDDFLDDPTGSRRFWPVTVGPELDLEGLAAVRDQLWAEACEAYANDGLTYLTRAEAQQLVVSNAAFESDDAWTQPIVAWLEAEGRDNVTVHQVAEVVFHIPHRDLSRSHQMRIAKILRRLNFVRHKQSWRVVWRRAR